ncbi:MAG: hypothetical protein E7Y34_00600 [Mycoplasma sp.]|nr:hypothetical protein [Mycoplasma sp.]
MNEKLLQIKNLIEKNEKIALFSHIRPDGDSLSSSYGLALSLKNKYPEKIIKVCASYDEFVTFCRFTDFDKEMFIEEIDSSWLVIIGDCAVSKNIRYFEQYKKAGWKICYDHHLNDIDFEVDVYWKESSYIASAMQGYEISRFLEVKHDKNSAFYSLIGIVTDSGNFTYSLSNPLAPKYFASLLEYVDDVQMDTFWKRLRFRTKRDLELDRILCDQLSFKDKVAYVLLDKKIINDNPEFLTKYIANFPANIAGYPIWMVAHFDVKEDTKQEIWKLHFRSNGPNVQQVALQFNGGGHHRAAGAQILYEEDIFKVIDKLNQIGV